MPRGPSPTSQASHVAGFNLGILMRPLPGQGTDTRAAFIFVLRFDDSRLSV